MTYSNKIGFSPGARERSTEPEFGDQTHGVGGPCLEDIPARFPGGRENRPHDGNILCTVVGTEATGDLLPQFHHPTVAFREVVGAGHAPIGERAQYILSAATLAQQQIITDPPRPPAAS